MRTSAKAAISCAIAATLLTFGAALGGRQANELSSNPTEFTEQMTEILMQGTDKARSKSAVAQLNKFMASGAGVFQDIFIETCQKMQKKKARPFPDYVNALTTFEELATSNRISGKNLDVWRSVLDDKCKNLNKLRAFFEQTSSFVTTGAICSSRSVAWRVVDLDKVEFEEADGDLNYNVGTTTLRCLSQNDSIEILETSGKFYTKTSQWTSFGGKITWERAGLSADSVFATFGFYSISMKSNEFSISNCSFTNRKYFNEPLIGTVTNKCLNRNTTYGKRYPKFETAEGQRMEKMKLFDNVSYSGGFTQTGTSFVGSGSVYLPAEVSIHKGDTVLATFSAPSFIMGPRTIESSGTEVNINLDDGAIRHPGLTFRYIADDHEVQLMRGKKGMERAKYRDTYHNVNFDASMLTWNIMGKQIYISDLPGTPTNRAYFESVGYYSEEQFNEIWGMNTTHPMQTIADFVRYNGGSSFPVKDFAQFTGMTHLEAQRMMLSLSYDGFVDYYVERDIAHASDRLYDYLKYNVGRKDYDEMRFLSLDDDSIKNVNGYIDLEDLNIHLRKVRGVQISEAENLNIYLTPTDGEMVLKKNRDIDYNGIVTVGQVSATGTNFHFDYDAFDIRLDSIKSMSMNVTDSTDFRNGQYQQKQLGSTLTDLSGIVQLNDPTNKSGKQKIGGFPRLSSTTPGKIYYGNGMRGEDGTTFYYDSAQFYFIVDTFTFEDINNISNSNLPFTGVLHTNILPDIRHDLSIRPDGSLGFKDDTPPEGYPIYGGKGTFYRHFDLSNKGLRGAGEIEFSACRATCFADLDADGEFSGSAEEYFHFFQEHAEGNTRQMDVRKSTAQPSFPQVELGANQKHRNKNNFEVPGKSQMKFYPQEDHMDFRNMEGKFHMFPNEKKEGRHECLFSGQLTVTSAGLRGIGRGDLEIVTDQGLSKSSLESRAIAFTDHEIKADTSYFVAFALGDDQQQVVASGELRRDIINKVDGDVYTAKASITRGHYLNDAIREDSIVNKVCRDKAKGKKVYRKLMSRSQETYIDFDKREGHFQYNSAGGNEKDFSAIKYTTMVKNYTWDLERGEETIGTNGSKGNRFVCTKERGDSLNFLVPVAVFDRNANILRCEEVKFIDVADARVNLSAGDIVTIRKNAEMDELKQTRVDVKTDSASHSFDKANITILGAKEYKGFGNYTFVDNEGGRNVIFMGDIYTDDAVTVAKGLVQDDMPVDKWFAFKGLTSLRGDRKLLEFDGGARMRVTGKKGPKGYIRFDAILNPAKVRIPVDKRSFNTTEGNAKDKQDEIFHSFRISKDTTHVYSTMMEHYKDVADLPMISAPTGYLYHNNIFDRYEINSPEKIAKPDTLGTYMCYYPGEDAVTAFGQVDTRVFLTKKPTGKFDMRNAGDLRHDRGGDVITANLLTEMYFYMHPEVTMLMYNDIMKSKAPKCDSTSLRYERRMAELYDTASVRGIMRGQYGGFDPKTKMMLDNGPVLTMDGVQLTWSTPKKSYVCDTTVNLMMIHYLPVYKKVKLQAEYFVRKGGGSRVRMILTFDPDTWYYIDFRGDQGGWNKLSVRSSNPDVTQTLGRIDTRDRQDRSRSTRNLIAQENYMQTFIDNFGLNHIPDDAYAQAEAEDIIEGGGEYEETEEEAEETETGGEEETTESEDENAEDQDEDGEPAEEEDEADYVTTDEAVDVEDYLNGAE